MYPVELSGRLVVLREFRTDDAVDALAVYGDNTVTHWLSFDSRDQGTVNRLIAEAIERAQSVPRPEYYLAVTLPDDTFIGFVRLGFTGIKAAKLGYAIRADHWGKGYATGAARTLTDFGFSTLGIHRVSAAIGPENKGSIAVARHLGMTYEGRIRDHVFTNGGWRDSLLYSVLAHEWNSEPSA